MTTMELEAYKAELQRELSTINSRHALDEIKRVLSKFVPKSSESNAPCCYTLEEARHRMAITDADAEAGIGFSEEEVEQRIKKLL